MLSQRLIGKKISRSEVSKMSSEFDVAIDQWRTRNLSKEKIKYMYIDGVYFNMRFGHKIEKLPMLVVIGVTDTNRKMFLTIQMGDKEKSSTWREVFKDMKKRNLNASEIQLGIMDGLPGLEKVFSEEFPNAKIQRCQVHLARNILSKTPKNIKQEVSDHLRDIFYAPSKKEALKNYETFQLNYEKIIPSASKSLSNNIDKALTFFSFPEEHWISLRTTNPIERVNKEFKRRTKPMEVLAGEKSAYKLLCFIGFKMELTWKKAPLGRNNLPTMKQFTQNY